MTDDRPPRPDPVEFTPSAVPDELRDREQWLVWSQDSDPEKKPLNREKKGASWNDPDEWLSFEDAVELVEADDYLSGVGYVIAEDDPYLGIDLDGCLRHPRGKPKDWLSEIGLDPLRGTYIEYSCSGTGLHAFVECKALPDWWRDVEVPGGEHEGVEAYESKFFIMTGEPVDLVSAPTIDSIDPASWLFDAYETITGEHPHLRGSDDAESDNPDHGGREWLEDDDIGEALSHIDPDVGYETWRDIGFAIHDYDSGTTGRRLFAEWSRGGSKWDDRAKRYLDAIWNSADQGRGVTLGTLVHLARENGWTMPTPPARTNGGTTTVDDQSGGFQQASNMVPGGDEGSVREQFAEACRHYHLDPSAVASETRDGVRVFLGVDDILPETSIGDAVMAFNRDADRFDGTDRQAVIGRVVIRDLEDGGEFFQTADDRLFYFDETETEVYRVDGTGRRVLDEDFQGMVWERYNLFAGNFSRNLGTDLRSQARRDAPVKQVYQFAHFDRDAGELYVTDWGDGYYAVTPSRIEWRPNGTDLYFLTERDATPFQYLEDRDRVDLAETLPGERDLWAGTGDPVMRMFGNRINYDEEATLGPTQQRMQLYVHLHTLPFIDVLNARPIMAWVGEKGSGKTVIQRSIGRFLYGGDYSESVMPDAKDDFLAKVTNQALAFVDNYDDAEKWANDVLAAIATGAGIDKRELYTTNELRRDVPRCWLSITSRDPPFRRDDVADRTLVFRVERVEDGFVGMGDYLRQVTDHRDLLWSAYLENLQGVVAEYIHRSTDTMSSSHRMADWAIFARIVADALDVDGMDELLETMEAERATFALENEAWAAVIGDWIQDHPDVAGQWHAASELADLLAEAAEEGDRQFHLNSASALGGKLSQYHTELGELYGLEIDDSRRANRYRFDSGGGSTPTTLGGDY